MVANFVESPSGRSEQLSDLSNAGGSGAPQGEATNAFSGEHIEGDWKVTYNANATGFSLAKTELLALLGPCE